MESDMRKYVLSVAFSIFSGSVHAQAGDNISGFYSGVMGKNTAVTLSLRQSGANLDGYYHYDKNNVDIRMTGQIDSAGIVKMEELGYFEATGYWNGKIADGRFTGEWLSGDKARKLTFSLNTASKDSEPGQPMSGKVAFGAKRIDIPAHAVAVPRKIASRLFDKMIEWGEVDVENEYNRALLEKSKRNPSQLFVGEKIDLDNDGDHELVVYPSGEEGACTAHNCSIWLFRNNGGTYTEILQGQAGIAGYSALNSVTNGFFDIVLGQHSSAAETDYDVYRFDGTAYRLANCINSVARENKRGEVVYAYKEHPCR